ncbi:MAG TPA: prephenate dehydratase [Fibrobacteraceae bacterium]|nr:prephenate dehydratase [Fibrobacteraceae bacterium]
MSTIAFQGRRGAYSESAAYSLFGSEIAVQPVDSFEELHRLVQGGQVDGGVIPIENSTAGSIHDNYDLLLRYRQPIVGEVKLQIEHCLFALPGETLESLHEVISHPQALAQCSKFFADHPHIQRTAFFDTAGSAEEIANKRLCGIGGIASTYAARYYGLEILREPLANLPGSNFTRFFAIQKEAPPLDVQRDTKTSLIFVPRQNEPGILYRALGCFATRDIDLLRIESRPLQGSPWQYVFYLDFEGNPGIPKVHEAMEELKSLSTFLHHLGSYPDGKNRTLKYKDAL